MEAFEVYELNLSSFMNNNKVEDMEAFTTNTFSFSFSFRI